MGKEIDPLDAFMAELEKSEAPKRKAIESIGPIAGEILDNDEDGQATDNFEMEQETMNLMVKKRKLEQTNHEMIYYRPFRRDFYVEVPELQKMSKEDVKKYREELEGIKVKGSKCPKPIKNWAQAGVETKVLNMLKRLNYVKPTPIQAQAIPAILNGRDIIGISKTGSGKTLAFLLPMFRHILDQDLLQSGDGPIALIMSPTRELALQTYKEANKFCRPLGLNVVCVYGGVGIPDQIRDLKRGTEIVVCTPGRLIEMLATNKGKVTNLRRVTYLVLDEADRMFDMGFEPQVMKIVNNIRPDRQTILFSATFPKSMEALARKILVKPIEIQAGGKSVVCADIEQNAMIVPENSKFLKLLELLARFWERGNVLVFVEKQEKADDIVGQLMHHSYNCAPLHGGIDQYDRDSTLSDFKKGTIKLLVATSVAARGLDVKKLILVVNYDCPNHYEDYVHRVGRTGRAGNKGFAYTFVLPSGQERLAGEVCRAFETAGLEAPAELKEMWELFKAQMMEQGIEVRTGGGGFAGTGFKYDDEEDEQESKKRTLTKLVHGLQTGEEDDIENQLSSIMKPTSRKNEPTNALALAIPTPIRKISLPVLTTRPALVPRLTKAEMKVQERKVASAKAAAQKIVEKKKINVQPVIEKETKVLPAETTKPEVSSLPPAVVARQAAEKLNAKLTYIPSALKVVSQFGENAEYFEEELEINDFPQQLRFRVCSREVIMQIREFVDVAISIRGVHYPPGREPKEGMERKMYLLLEARDHLSLKRAREEILRIMKETLQKMTETGIQQASGRYNLL